MADNVSLPLTGSGAVTATARTKDRTGIETQIVALDLNPAGTETLMSGTMPISGQSAASAETGTVYSGSTALTPKFKVITASATGATTIVALVASKKIRVLKWDMVANGAVNVKWQSSVTPTDITGLYYFAANGGIESGFCPVGHFETIAGEALNINLSGAVAVGGVLTYVEV